VYPRGLVWHDGALYGVTSGGQQNRPSGVVFQLTPPQSSGGSWSYTGLHQFDGGNDGQEPNSAPVFDSAGNLYGTTTYGPSSQACGRGCGVVYKVAPPATSGGTWQEAVIYAFYGTNGSGPTNVAFLNVTWLAPPAAEATGCSSSFLRP
jgi:hypothetical protein